MADDAGLARSDPDGVFEAPSWSEEQRLAALRAFAVLDTPREQEFDDLVVMAAQACGAPISVINLIEDTRQWFKAEVGLGVRETPLDVSICARVLIQPGLTVVPDLRRDPRFNCNPLVTGDLGLRFYAGAVLETPDGLPLGTLCVLDHKPRPKGLTREQAFALQALARQVMTQLELRRALFQQRRAEQAAQISEERLRIALDASAFVGTWDWDIPNDVLYADSRFAQFYGVDPERAAAGAPITDFMTVIHPDDYERVSADVARAIETGEPYTCEYRLLQPDGEVRWVLARGRAYRDEAGRPLRFPGVTVDVTERKQATQRQKLLLRELNHRVKNLFAIATGMVALSARSASTPKEMAESLRGRLGALARANDLIRPGLIGGDVEAGEHTTVDALIRTVLLPYVDEERAQVRQCVVLNGPAVPVGGNAATSLALVLHETTTNSAKYGALSVPEGCIRVDWTVREDDLYMRWEEVDGPKVAEPPTLNGFGTILVKRSVVGQLQGTVEYDWRQEGLTMHVMVPLARLHQ
jgi:PAS domain S-box-containing protein